MNAKSIEADRALIESLGGPAKVAERLNYNKRAGGLQRVQNWKQRGIPAHVKVQHPELFLQRGPDFAPEIPPEQKVA